MSKRSKLAATFEGLGFTRALERLPHSPGILVINYHRVGDIEAEPFEREVYEASAEQFDEQVATLKQRYGLISLPELQDFVDHPQKLRHFHTMLTFDDGYIDNFKVAYPILKAHNTSATFFLCTSLIGSSYLPWWDRIAYMVRNSRRNSLPLSCPIRAEIDLTQDREAAIIEVLRIFKAQQYLPEKEFLSHISEIAQVDQPQPAGRRFMDWHEAAQLLRGGMFIGSHTHSHNVLSQLSFIQQCEDLSRSKSELESNLGAKIDALAYPVGSPATFNSDTARALEATGYKTAFSHYYGINTPQKLNRFDVMRAKPSRDRSIFRLNASLAASFNYAWI